MKHSKVIDILASRGIPFICVNYRCYIVPGGIIKIYGSTLSGHQKAINRVANFMYNCLDILPAGGKIWLMVTGKYDQSSLNDILAISYCIKYINTLDDVVISDYIISCNSQEYLRTLCSTYNKNYDQDVAARTKEKSQHLTHRTK